MVFLAAAANIGVGTLLCGKAAAETEEGKKDTHGTAKRGREGGEADMRVVQCLIHASAVSDSVSNAQAFKLRAALGKCHLLLLVRPSSPMTTKQTSYAVNRK